MFKLTRSTSTPPPQRLCVVGIGGGGCSAINQVDSGAGGPAIAAVSTDSRALAECHAVTKIQLGAESAEELGTGGDPDLGKLAAERNTEMIRGLFTDTDVAVIVTCLGGGTGTGATPVVVDAARSAGVFTIVLATLPFSFEGEKRKRIAAEGLAKVVAAADCVCVIPNDKLFDAVGESEVKKAFLKAAGILASGIYSLWNALALPAFIGIDLADLRALASSGATACRFGFGEATGTGRAQSAVKALLAGPVLEKGKVLRDSMQAVVCVAGSHDLTITETGDIMAAISAEVSDDCDITMGTVVNDKWRDRLLVSVFVGDGKRSVTSTPRAATTAPKGSRKRKQDLQDKLKLEVSGKGRFKNVEATILDGQDLDIPTYVRRGIQIEK